MLKMVLASYISRISGVDSLDTKCRMAHSRKDKFFGTSEKACSIPSLTIFKISNLCLFLAAPTYVPESRAANSLHSRKDLPVEGPSLFVESSTVCRW